MKQILQCVKRLIKRTLRYFKKQVPVYIPILQTDLLNGRVALITGGTSGIGFAIAKSFLNSGATVVITGRNIERVKNTCNKLISINTGNYTAKVYGIEMDISKTQKIEEKFWEVISLLDGKKIDILVNNAGILQEGMFGNISENDYDATLNTNLKGTYFLSQIVANYMKTNKISGNILNIASSSSLRPAISPYTVTKWGIRGLTLGLAKALIPYGIVVNGLAPGPTATSLLIKDGYNGIEHTLPAGRYVTAEEIANMAVVLVSACGKMIIGDIIYMTGGAGTITLDDVPYIF